MFTLDQIESTLRDNPEKAKDMTSEYLAIHPKDSRAYFLRGKAYWRLGLRSSAIADYETATQLDPSSPAVAALAHSKDIMNFFNPDLLNP